MICLVLKKKWQPIAAITKEKLQEVGYNVTNINFAKMTTVHKQNNSHEEVKNELNEEDKRDKTFMRKD